MSFLKADAVILNPIANSGNGARRWKSLLETEVARERGLAGAALFDGSQGLDTLAGWISDRLRAGATRFVAAGGDGTLNLALNELMRAREGRSVVLGAVGLGSSNDFQKPYDGTGRLVVAKLHCRLDFEGAKAHDIGRLRSTEGPERFFAINASVGVTAEANWNFNQARGGLGFLKRRWVDGAIIATALKTFGSYKNFKARVRVDGGAERELALTNLGVVKNVHFSGQMRYDVPQAPDDGQFGVHLCEAMSALEMVGVLGALNAGRFSGRPKTSSLQARLVEVSAERPFAVEADGEVLRTTSARLDLLARELALCP